ncbi:MAG TPA: ATP-binding protein [Nocardioidaceae bacterium]|jgi:signal transduction histidine kinase|nr:ATP-binding protein [Nocardioidaceae bacterium]
MRTLGLRGRVAFALGLVTVVALAVVAVAASLFVGLRHQQSEVIDHYYAAVTLSHEQYVHMVEAEAAIRGYVLSDDPESLGPVTAMQEPDVQEATRRLDDLLANDPRSSAALATARQASEEWWTGWGQPTIAAVQRGERVSLDGGDAETGRRLFGQVRTAYEQYLKVLGEQRETQVHVLEDQMTRLFLAVLAVAATVIVGVGALWFLLRRWVTEPVTDLAEETRHVRDGDLTHRVQVAGPPEIEGLGRDVEEMRQRLVQEVELARQATEQLAQNAQTLEEQTQELARSNRELEQFAYVASHDLQEPLRKVASFTQMLQRRYAGQLDERADQYIDFAVDGAKRMQQLINDLLEFSRVGRITSPETDVSLATCLDRALRDLDTALEESGAVVTHDELPVVRGEAPLLTQLMVNLVGNAVKFHGDEPPRIHIGARRDGNWWQMWCSDNGIGIEPQYAERVFAVFQRLHPKDVYAGTGIGLALCKKIVEYHGGTIWIDTQGAQQGEQTQGTTVCWTLPVDGAVATHRLGGAPAEANGRGEVVSSATRDGGES